MTYAENIIRIKHLCAGVVVNGRTEDVLTLGKFVREVKSWKLFQNVQKELLATHYFVLKNESQNKYRLKEDEKLVMLETLSTIFANTKLDSNIVFFNFFGFLLVEVYDTDTHKIRNTSEEHKLSVMLCTKALLNSTDSDCTLSLYTKENGKKLCKMIFVTVEIVLNEKYRALRIAAIESMMALFKVHSDSDYADLLYRSMVAECFSFFLPGVASCLRCAALQDEKVGYKLIQMSIRAMGRILSLLMQDYKSDNSDAMALEEARTMVLSHMQPQKKEDKKPQKNKLEEYMECSREPDWFRKSDMNLAKLFADYRKLTLHQMVEIRKELSEMCILFLQNCKRTMPKTLRHLVEILIILSEDTNEDISRQSRETLKQFDISSDDQSTLLKNSLHNGFYETFSAIPNIFNGIDDREKIAVLKLTTGYVNLFGKKLQFNDCLRELMFVLLHLCQFEVDFRTFEENVVQDLEEDSESNSNLWKNLKFLKDDNVRKEFNSLCHSLVRQGLFEIITDFLITIHQNEEERKESTYLLNQCISALSAREHGNKLQLIKPIFNIYTEPDNWNLPISTTTPEYDGCLPLRVVRSNIQQVTLNVNGIGIMADILAEDFRPLLLNTLFLVLNKAGSAQPLIRTSGKEALKSLAKAFSYSSVTELINNNMDYFAFFIERCLKKGDMSGNAFDVMEVVISYGNKDTLNNLLSIVEEVLVLSCDRFKQNMIDSYLKIFRVFFKKLMELFEVSLPSPLFKTKFQKENELQGFQVTGLENVQEITDFSDKIMSKSAEEMYKEDEELKRIRETQEEDIDDEEQAEGGGYKKPEPPDHIKITVTILKRSLNFLPSKEKDRKLLVLEILTDGVSIIKEFEDELLPIVHLIWSPLVCRFKDVNEPVIINYSFKLLNALATFSKDFIRHRTTKEVLSSILDILTHLSKESYMKDKGSAYRYTQSYKLQLTMLEGLPYIVTNIDLLSEHICKVMSVVFLYLNNKQPVPLQCKAVEFFRLIIEYDPTLQDQVKNICNQNSDGDYHKNLEIIKNYIKT